MAIIILLKRSYYANATGGRMANDRLAVAKNYALLGWSVVLLHSITKHGFCSCGNKNCRSPGKHPRLKHGLKDATTDEKQIETWFKQSPFANIGIVTGESSGLFVLDIDPKNGGLDTLEKLIDQHGPVPDDVMQITGSGGRHYVFKYPGEIGRSTTNLWPGIDTRGTGGYIVVAPSNHVSGNEYFWDAEADPLEGAKPSDCPQWLLKKLAEKSSITASSESNSVLIEKTEVKRIRAALAYIPADDREIWLKIGMALNSTQAEDQAFGLWCEWAMQSEKFDLADSRRVWASFKPNGVAMGSLFAAAKARGWTPPDNRPPDPPVEVYADDLKKDSQTKPRKKRPQKDGGIVDHELCGDILKRYIFLKNHNRIYDLITRNELTRDGFDGAYLHKFNDSKPSTFFLKNSETIKVDGLIYLPGMTDNPVRRNGAVLWNIWTDPKVSLPDQANDDDIALWLDHLSYLYPNADEQKHLLDWFAWTLQHPATKINHALLIAGTSRVGKDTLLNPLRYGLGERNVCEPPATELKENYTDYLHHAKLVIFQEIQTFEGLNLENKLKPMLAAPPDSLRVRLFGRGFYETPNIVQAIFMS
ncbi:MAG: bifunctional DNA primase/polymerase, partial [Methylomicrobium sp.]|nr:bifunctional DNA primase/polymerase [Methylomicrobium sp.]